MLQGLKDRQPQALLKILFTYSNKNGTGFSGDAIPCVESCYCAYCAEACKKGEQMNPDYGCTILRQKCLHFGIIVVSVIVSLVIVAMVVAVTQRYIKWHLDSRRANQLSVNDDRSKLLSYSETPIK
jgi:hypothetical protein